MDKLLDQQLANLPIQPGIYQFFDRAGKLLYVGKAKSLKKRVMSYFRPQAKLTPIKTNMVAQITEIRTLVVDNENEALLLENNLIKQNQPPYNIVFKDDKNWFYLAIDYREKFPRVELTRRRGGKGIKYFGPFTSAWTIRSILYTLKKILKFRTCHNPPTRPCFDSKLDRCLGHDIASNSLTVYNQQLVKLKEFLTGKGKKMVAELKNKMLESSRQHKYEIATLHRNQLSLINKLLDKQKIIYSTIESFDVINTAINNNSAAINILVIRHGLMIGSEQILIDHQSLDRQEILLNFIEQYYPQVIDQPKTILSPMAIKPDIKIKITVPKKGKKQQLINLAETNAENYLNNSLATWQKRSQRSVSGLKQLKKILALKVLPNRIEGYDISNIQGTNAVGVMVVLTNGLIDKSQYRKFTIKKVKGPNDVAMLAEVLTRRFKSSNTWLPPDLIMLDGGKSQLTTVGKIFKKKRIKIPLVALAKKEESLFTPNKKTGIKLPINSPALLLLEQLRDEAHRFGITFYRSKHRKSIIS